MARLLSVAAALFCLATAACSSSSGPNEGGMSGAPGAGASGALAAAGAPSAGSSGSAGSSAAGASGSAGSTGGVAGSTGGNGGAAGASGSGGMSGAGGASSNLPVKGRTGKKSAGCGKQAMGATSTAFTNHRIAIPACAACTIPNCPKNCVAPPFVPGGRDAQTAPNGETLVDRDFTIQLPANYDSSKPYPVFFGADGCGPQPPQKGAGFSAPGEEGAIKIGLQQVSLPSVGNCFADGGIRCAPDIKNVADCVNGPEIPYFINVQNWVEANFCVDLGSEFAGGGSSGAWETLLAGCASSDTLRGTYTVAGGLREHRWACNGPTAAFMIVSDVDMNNPVGPLPQLFTIEDSYGSAPARDELLVRNGCIGRDHAAYDAKYPECQKYTGCPAEYPVVWCEFPGGSHDNPNYDNVNYLNAVLPFFMALPPAP